jgi:DNA-binding winged helix-turn-helix (wHTH) protein
MATLDDGGAFTVGQTVLRVRRSEALESDATLRLEHEAPALTLRRSTRELVNRQGVVVAALSESEGAALAALALSYPDAASHEDLGRAVWGDLGYDRYQIHRLLTRLRQRLGDQAELLENVRGAGYRLTGPIVVA